MKFSSKEDIEAPVETVFDMLSDFEFFERAAIRRGAEVERETAFDPPRIGASWMVRFQLRGRSRVVRVVLVEYDGPNGMRFDGHGQGIDGYLTVELLALSPSRTRMAVAMNLAPKSLSARLMVQSLKLAKSSLTKRFKLRVAEFARQLEDRQNRVA